MPKISNSNPDDLAGQARTRILRAALGEFSVHGLAGARTDVIAESAKVNKALLYYYFKNKESLYTAAFEEVLSRIAQSTMAVLESKCTPGEQLLRLAAQPLRPHPYAARVPEPHAAGDGALPARSRSTSIPLLVSKLFAPLLKKMQQPSNRAYAPVNSAISTGCR